MRKSILVIVCLLFTACSKKEMPSTDRKHIAVETMHAYNMPYIFDYPAVVQGIVDYSVTSRVDGVVYKQFYTEGTYVKKDTPLYQIDPRPYELNLQLAQGNLLKDKTTMDNTKIIYERYVTLYKTFAVSKQDIESALIRYQGAVGAVKTDQANINQAKLELEYCVVRAPASGYISERQVTIGTMVNAYQTVMNVINSADNMYINFSIPENDRRAIQSDMASGKIKILPSYKFRVALKLADKLIMKNAGYVQFADTRIGLQNGVWNMRAYVDNKDLKNQLLAGQFVHVYLQGAQFENTFAVPQASVFRDDQGVFVYLVEDNKIVKQPVDAGRKVGDLLVINSGLKEGDRVVVNGDIKVSPNDKVIVDSDKAQMPDGSNPALRTEPKSVTPAKVNASAFKANHVQKVKVDNREIYAK